jgi:hypothetical protein
MSNQATPSTVTVDVPMRFSVRGGRKAVISEISPAASPSPRTEDALQKALAKAFRWRKQPRPQIMLPKVTAGYGPRQVD